MTDQPAASTPQNIGPETLKDAGATVAADLLAQQTIAELKHERNVLQKICAERSDELAAVNQRNAELNERLENNHAFNVHGERIEVEPGSIADGIECRDETIKLADRHIATLTEQLAEARPVAQEAVACSTCGGTGHLYHTDEHHGHYGWTEKCPNCK